MEIKMRENEILTSAVVLESLWSINHKDLLDLVAPFIQYTVAKTSTPATFLNTEKITAYMRAEFGYADIPETVIIKILKRDKEHFSQQSKKIFYKKSLCTQEQSLDTQKEQGKLKIDTVIDALFPYLKVHCVKSKGISREWTIDMLLKFMSNFGMQIGFENLEIKRFSPKDQEIEYYISQFVFEEKEKKSLIYDYILSLVKGFLLKAVIYLQIENDNLLKSSYKNLKIFYDTPFLINLLHFQSDDEYRAANDLHILLKKQGASFYYFPQTRKEIDGILSAYKSSLWSKESYRTLEGLDKQKYSSSDVERLKQRWPSLLESNYNIYSHELPRYKEDHNGFVDGECVRISEKELIEYIRGNTVHYSDENLKSDATSIIAIENLRDGFISSCIEKCAAIFVTTNIDLTKAIRSYYKKNKITGILPVITAFDLSAIAWVKSGSISKDVPESQLLINSYMAMQPSSGIINRCKEVLDQLEREGKITSEDALMLRADKVTQRECWKSEFPTSQEINENYIRRMNERHKERLLAEDRKLDLEAKVRDIRRRSQEYAAQKRVSFLKIEKIFVYIVVAIIFFLGLSGLISSFNGSKITIRTVIYLIASILSFWDTFFSRKHFINSCLNKLSYRFETYVREKKYNEWIAIINYKQDV